MHFSFGVTASTKADAVTQLQAQRDSESSAKNEIIDAVEKDIPDDATSISISVSVGVSFAR